MISAFKKRIALALALVFLLQVFSSVFIYADFIINNEYIATVLCINKEKPELHCDGKCYLKMQLGKDESKKQSEGKIAKENNVVQFIYEPYATGISFQFAPVVERKASFYYHEISTQELSLAIFHPPQV